MCERVNEDSELSSIICISDTNLEADINQRIVNLIRNNDIHELGMTIDNYDHSILFKDKYPLISYIFAKIAHEISVETLQCLLKSSAVKIHLNTTNARVEHKRAIHFASEAGYPKLLEELLHHLTDHDVNLLSDVGTALHHVIRAGKSADINLECAQLLIDNGIDINEVDRCGKRPIDLLVVFKNIFPQRFCDNFIKLLLSIDNRCSDETATYLREYDVIVVKANECVTNSMNYYLCTLQEDKFSEIDDDDIVKEYKGVNLLTYAASNGLVNVVERILSKFISAVELQNLDIDENPLYIAAKWGYYETFQHLQRYVVIDNIHIEASIYSQLVDEILDENYLMGTPIEKVNYEEVLHSIIINHRRVIGVEFNPNYCKNGVYILQIATQFNFTKLINMLLFRNNVRLNMLNVYNELTIEIPLECLSKYLNRCIKVRTDKDRTFMLEFNLEALICKQQIDENQSDVLFYLSKSITHRSMLQHPVLKLVINLKWEIVQYVYYALFLLYFIFFLLHLLDSTLVSKVFIIILFVKSLFLASLNLPFNFIDESDMVLIIVTLIDVLNAYTSLITQKYIVVVQMFAFTYKLFMFIKFHPKYSIYYQMFEIVVKRYFQLMFWFLLLFVVFAYSFYYLFADNAEFDTLQDSFFTTFFMIVKGVEYEKLKFSLLSYIVFMLFSIIVVIIITNLLIAYATIDLEKLEKDAKFLTTLEACRYIYYVEAIVMQLQRMRFMKNFMSIDEWKHYVKSGCGSMEEDLKYEAKMIALENRAFF